MNVCPREHLWPSRGEQKAVFCFQLSSLIEAQDWKSMANLEAAAGFKFASAFRCSSCCCCCILLILLFLLLLSRLQNRPLNSLVIFLHLLVDVNVAVDVVYYYGQPRAERSSLRKSITCFLCLAKKEKGRYFEKFPRFSIRASSASSTKYLPFEAVVSNFREEASFDFVKPEQTCKT